MKKYAKRIFTFLLVFTLVFGISGVAAPQTANAGFLDFISCAFSSDGGGTLGCALRSVILGIMQAVLGFAGLIVGLAGVVLNGVVHYTVVNVADNYANLTAINSAWTTVRDLANMVFIFLLLYVAIRIILGWGEESKRLIINIIIVAILINFSLFFTKIVIDASNILALFFYDAINPGAATANLTLAPDSTSIADQFMARLELSSLYNTPSVDNSSLFTIGVMGTMMLMIAAFTFFSVAIMFAIRYVALILVLILSPLAFLSFAFPALRGAGSKWLDALIGQAFFAPIYFMITWIALRVLGDVAAVLGINPGDLSNRDGALGALAADPSQLSVDVFMVFLNFLIVIIFIIASLSIAKSWANRAGSGATKAHRLISGAAIGTAAFAGRQTIGRAATRLSESEYLKNKALDEKASAGARMMSRLTLATGRKVGGASFDARGAGLGIGSSLDAGKAGGKGGYVGSRKAYADKQAKAAESYAPSERTKAKAKSDYDDAVNKFGAASPQALEAKKKRDNMLGNNEEITTRISAAEEEKKSKINKAKDSETLRAAENKEKSAYDTVSRLETEVNAATDTARAEKMQQLNVAKEQLKSAKQEAQKVRLSIKDETDIISAAYEKQIEAIKGLEIQSADKVRKEAFAKRMEKSILGKLRGYNYAAASQVRKGSKSAKDKLAEAAKEYSDELEGGTKDTTPPPPPSPAPGGGTSTT